MIGTGETTLSHNTHGFDRSDTRRTGRVRSACLVFRFSVSESPLTNRARRLRLSSSLATRKERERPCNRKHHGPFPTPTSTSTHSPTHRLSSPQMIITQVRRTRRARAAVRRHGARNETVLTTHWPTRPKPEHRVPLSSIDWIGDGQQGGPSAQTGLTNEWWGQQPDGYATSEGADQQDTTAEHASTPRRS